MESLLADIHTLGKKARNQVGARDVADFRRLKRATIACEIAGRLCLQLVVGPIAWFVGMALVAFHLAVEAQLNHTVMHGAFVGIPDAEDLQPRRYESLALPFRTQTWRRAHRIHHANPSLLERDPDTMHPLFRVHARTRFRFWHALNTFIGAIFVFEHWALDYDRFLKRVGQRPPRERLEHGKLALFFAYQYVFFPLLAGPRWWVVLLANLVAVIIRNFVFVALQTGSSVGAQVSTAHAELDTPPKRASWVRFQIETSKNFVLPGVARTICGGLDRHIEHHLFPDLPPARLHALSPEVRALCARERIRYEEHSSVWSSLGDSLAHLASLSRPRT